MTPALLRRYAQRLSPLVGSHGVASPLGAWLLLALAAEATTGAARDAVEEALGCSASSAAGGAAALLADPHPAVSSAAASWHSSATATERLGAWLATLPPSVERGPLPSTEAADAWVRERSQGLLDRFPLAIDEDTLLVLATVLATRVTWHVPFDLAPAGALGAAWGVERVLRRPPAPNGTTYVVATAAAGDVAAHLARAEGLDVWSVVAAPGVPAADVLDAAHEVAGGAAARSLYDLPLGDGHSWTLTEEAAVVLAPSGREERRGAVLPAWTATSSLDLASTPGFGPAAGSLLGLFEPDPRGGGYAARQVAVASFSRRGFEAAAVSAFGMAGSAMPRPRDGRVRTLEVSFARPYAAVAVATAPSGGSPWAGLPVFCAWVGEAVEAHD